MDAWKDAAVVVRTTSEYFSPRFGMRRRESMAIGKLVDFRGGQSAEDEIGYVVEKCIAITIDPFEVLKKQGELFQMRGA